MKVLLCYPPFCTPASPPYSITNIYGFLSNNSKHEIKVLDLNIKFHNRVFKEYKQYYLSLKQNFSYDEYNKITNQFREESKAVYLQSNMDVVKGKKPKEFEDMLKLITEHNPSIVAFSIVYSSQVFYTYALIKELKKRNIKCVVGGPSVNDKLREEGVFLKNEYELLEYIENVKIDYDTLNNDTILNYKLYDCEYFTPEAVYPIRTSSGCYYKMCTFCTHHKDSFYYEYPISNIEKSINISDAKNIFLIDDMIHKKRLFELCEIFKNRINWMCQLKPKDFSYDELKRLRESGLKTIIWGVESGSDRVLNLMNKKTNVAEIEQVLRDSKKAGIRNAIFIMFGFPSETSEEFIQTIDFLKRNKESIDIVSTSIFGLQKGSEVYKNPKKFGITKVNEESRTILEPKITYEIETGLSTNEATILRKKYKKTLESFNKYPKNMNFFREHLLLM